MTPEKKVKQAVIARLQQAGAYYFMPVANMFTRAGIPDIIACVDGKFIGIECKAGKNACTKLQEIEQGKIQKAGGLIYIINETNLHELDDVLCGK